MTDSPGNDGDLGRLLDQAIRQSLADFKREHPGETLAGYALCTDDELTTISWAATTREYSDSVTDPALRYGAVEWPYGDGSCGFDLVRSELTRRYETSQASGHFRQHITSAFRAMVEALARVRASGGLGQEVLAYVLSVDPSELLESLERQAVAQLNSPEARANWHSAHDGS